MSAYSRAAIVAAALFCVVCALGIGANAQITVTSPVNNSTISMPAQLTASVSACGAFCCIDVVETTCITQSGRTATMIIS